MSEIEDSPWVTPPRRPRAVSDVLDLWRADLDAICDEGLTESLCAEERAREERIAREQARMRWARSRGVLRQILARYLGCAAKEVSFASSGVFGKPVLADTPPASRLHFNLSHSGSLMLVAVTAEREVGVDLECPRERYTAEFMRAWTRREAQAKCLGTGLGFSPPANDAVREDDPSTATWTAELDVSPHAIAAVTVQGAEMCRLRRWDAGPTLTP